MDLTFPIISADDHVNPPPLMYGERLPSKWRARAPRVTPRVSHDLHPESARATAHGMLGIASRITLDEDPQPHDPANPLELAAERRLRDRKSVDRALPGSGRREIDGNVGIARDAGDQTASLPIFMPQISNEPVP